MFQSNILKIVSDALAFGIELVVLYAFGIGVAAFTSSVAMGWIAGITAALVIATFWGRYLAPMARGRLEKPARIAVKAPIFAGAAALVVAAKPIVFLSIVIGGIVTLTLEAIGL
jgi:hypothetical protein